MWKGKWSTKKTQNIWLSAKYYFMIENSFKRTKNSFITITIFVGLKKPFNWKMCFWILIGKNMGLEWKYKVCLIEVSSE